jgi:hypothetical protein
LGPDHDHVCVAADELSLHEALSPRQREAAVCYPRFFVLEQVFPFVLLVIWMFGTLLGCMIIGRLVCISTSSAAWSLKIADQFSFWRWGLFPGCSAVLTEVAVLRPHTSTYVYLFGVPIDSENLRAPLIDAVCEGQHG